jgi:hypothetical protein
MRIEDKTPIPTDWQPLSQVAASWREPSASVLVFKTPMFEAHSGCECLTACLAFDYPTLM